MVFSDYENSDTKFIISIDDEIVQHINAIENVSFNQSFYILIYSHLYSKKFYVFENKKVIIHDKYYQVKRKIEGFYMIHKDLCKRFNFEEFVSDFAYNKSNRYVAVFNIVEYIANKLSLENKRFQNEIYLVCKVLLAAEYDVKPDEQGNINFSKTILIKYPEICYNLLKKEAKPLHVNYMYEILQQSDTLRNIRKDAIRLAMIKNKDIFMYIGRSSIWGLNEWEKENPNYKGGSIRTIAFEFLQQRSSPTRRSELIEYILKYRPNSNHKSITQNLKIDIQKRFLFFENFYVGLAQKEYPEKPKLANTLIKDWESRVIETKEFIQTLKRFPKVNSKDKSEKSLASFFFRLRFLSRIGTLSKEKEDFLKSINFPLERKKIEPGLID